MLSKNKKDILRMSTKLPSTIFDNIYKNNITFLGTFIGLLIYALPLGILVLFLYRFSDYQDMGYNYWHLLLIFMDALILFKIKSIWIKLFTTGTVILASLYVYSMCNFLINKGSSIVNDFYPPRLEVTNINLNKNIDISLLKEYAENSNIKNSLSLIPLVDMKNRNFYNANFSNSVMYRFDFTNAKLNYAKFNNMRMPYTVFKGTELQNTEFLNTSLKFSFIDKIDFRKSKFKNNNFSESKIFKTDFSKLNLHNIDFSGSMINDSNFTDSQLSDSSFVGSMLMNIQFNYASLMQVDFSAAQIYFTNFRVAHLSNVDFIAVEGANNDIIGAFFFNVDFTGLSYWMNYNSHVYTGKFHKFRLNDKINVKTNFYTFFVVDQLKYSITYNGKESNASKFMEKDLIKLNNFSKIKKFDKYEGNITVIKRPNTPSISKYNFILKAESNTSKFYQRIIENNIKINKYIGEFKFSEVTLDMHHGKLETLDYYKNAIGKNNLEWIKFNKNQIIQGTLTKDKMISIIRKIKNNNQALKHIHYDEEKARHLIR